MTAPRHRTPGLRLRIVLPGGGWLGPGKADLLDRIAATGSILAAARSLGMSYKRAWGLVETMNALFSAPLVVSSRGGEGGGGASLTETGAEVLRHYRDTEAAARTAAALPLAAIEALAQPRDIPERK